MFVLYSLTAPKSNQTWHFLSERAGARGGHPTGAGLVTDHIAVAGGRQLAQLAVGHKGRGRGSRVAVNRDVRVPSLLDGSGVLGTLGGLCPAWDTADRCRAAR